ncbi:MAG: deoxyribose-phosphate aldolase [Lachnospiraceae bacterium]|nr:deoxyribose-phosphate aldolase [Lachnospiraceae bacterium]
MNIETMTREQLAGMMDHTFLKAYATKEDFTKLCTEAKENGFAMVAINSSPVKMCREMLDGTKVHVGAAISFPLGQTDVETKVFEAEQAILEGADEIDYVLNIGELKMGHTDYIKKEMEVMVAACHKHNILIKVIFENCYLTKEEIKTAAEIAKEVKPDFIKTSTGFGTSGATPEDVKLMKDTVGPDVKVKAAGGIRDWETCRKMIEAGAERIGTSNSIKICDEFEAAKGAN